MQLSEATELITHPSLKTGNPATWADLGCGTGTFTNALSRRLAKGSVIYAVDTNATALKQVQVAPGIGLVTQSADFIHDNLLLPPLDGILMANSLHYVAQQEGFAGKAQKWLRKGGKWLIVEYDSERGNHWVPYPVSRKALERLFAGTGVITWLGERPSVFGHANMYAALIEL